MEWEAPAWWFMVCLKFSWAPVSPPWHLGVGAGSEGQGGGGWRFLAFSLFLVVVAVLGVLGLEGVTAACASVITWPPSLCACLSLDVLFL